MSSAPTPADIDRDLTVLLPLKGRPEFTLRWMKYADSVRFPFRVLIADGGEDDTGRKVLSNKANFPNVDYEYLRHPYDQTYAEYYSKVVDALSRIATPFVAMADNDDLFVIDGLKLSTEFLCAHPDYSACGGQFGYFWITPSEEYGNQSVLYGKQIDSKWQWNTQSIIEETAAQRIQKQCSSYFYTQYDVQRTEELKSRFETLRDLNLKDLYLAEYLLVFLTGVAGKIKRLDRLYAMRQMNAPQTSSGTHDEKFGDAFERMLAESWSDDFGKFVKAVAAALAEKDGLPTDDARNHVKQCYRCFATHPVVESLLQEPTVTTRMLILIYATRRLVQLGRESVIRKAFHKLYRRVPWISAGATNGTELLTFPSSTYREDFKPIAEFLTRKPPTFDF